MNQKSSLLQKNEFNLFAFLVFLILMSWPFLTIFDRGHPPLIYYYLFLVWGSSIFVLFLMSRKFPHSHVEQKNQPEEKL